jgi:hypothetical protein
VNIVLRWHWKGVAVATETNLAGLAGSEKSVLTSVIKNVKIVHEQQFNCGLQVIQTAGTAPTSMSTILVWQIFAHFGLVQCIDRPFFITD